MTNMLPPEALLPTDFRVLDTLLDLASDSRQAHESHVAAALRLPVEKVRESLVRLTYAGLTSGDVNPLEALGVTPADFKVNAAIAEGLSDRTIARRFGTTRRAVARSRERLRRAYAVVTAGLNQVEANGPVVGTTEVTLDGIRWDIELRQPHSRIFQWQAAARSGHLPQVLELHQAAWSAMSNRIAREADDAVAAAAGHMFAMGAGTHSVHRCASCAFLRGAALVPGTPTATGVIGPAMPLS